MGGKLDDKYVDFNLNTAINTLKPENGGTGTNTLTAQNRVLTTVATGDATSPLKIAASTITTTQLGALSGYVPANGVFETRIQSLENAAAAQPKIVTALGQWTGSTISILADSGVSSISNVTTGIWQVNFDTPWANSNYIFSGGSVIIAGSTVYHILEVDTSNPFYLRTTTQFRFGIAAGTGSYGAVMPSGNKANLVWFGEG
jgi:hypothetical protein